ncbi:MAG TPA: P-type conjugative transfer protein VirB9 [Phenylobacterium sp.]|jgi:type IV secretion system protein VirB9|nr:P-type conjugative transfer protein VirB9 [Phenylobacterium sp.]
MRTVRLLGLLLLMLAPARGYAAVQPQPGVQDPRIQVVHYNPRDVVELRGTLGITTSIEFDPGEQLQTVAIGDSRAWQVTPNKRGSLLFIKPLLVRGPTNMVVITSLRRYDFSLKAQNPQTRGAASPVFGIRFEYPEPIFSAPVVLKASPAAAVAAPEAPTAKNSRYSFEGSRELRPARVFDDGTFTYFEFAANVDYPAVYAVEAGGKEAIMNFSVRQGYIVIDKISQAFVLRRGGLVAKVFDDAFQGAAANESTLPTRTERSGF